mmetsp:Transcript_15711/g.44043  ORF Transcript_15711/g.44043 Transcript_15711/m.44043 type:complete len:94 (+) Transcript_15711:189-470(+)
MLACQLLDAANATNEQGSLHVCHHDWGKGDEGIGVMITARLTRSQPVIVFASSPNASIANASVSVSLRDGSRAFRSLIDCGCRNHPMPSLLSC